MTIQRNNNVLVAIHRETAINVQATATGAIQMRIVDSPGLELKRAPIASTEKRTDQLKTMPRLGYRSVDGSYNTEMTVGGHTDLLHEAMLRTAWVTATAIDFASMTITLASNAVTAGSSSFLTNGVKVGDIFTISGSSVAADNGLNVRALAVTTGTIVVASGTYVTLTAAATGTLTILKKLTTPTSAPTRYSHTIEQYDGDTDLSELFTGARLVGVKLSCKPGSPVTVAYTFMAADRTALATGTSPYFTSPSLTTGLELICEDSNLRYNGAVAATFTGFELNFTIDAAGQPVVGAFVTPDIFDNDLTLTASITGMVQDFSNITLYDAETEFDVSILLQEPNTGPPKSCFSYFLPRVKIGARQAPVGGGSGPKIETLSLLIAPKVAATGYNTSIISVQSSAP